MSNETLPPNFPIEEDENNLNFFLFKKSEIRTCLYSFTDEKGEFFGLIQCFADSEQGLGGVIINIIPARGQGNKKMYNSNKELKHRYKNVINMTVNRPNFRPIWEGFAGWNFKEIQIEKAFEKEGTLVVWLN